MIAPYKLEMHMGTYRRRWLELSIVALVAGGCTVEPGSSATQQGGVQAAGAGQPATQLAPGTPATAQTAAPVAANAGDAAVAPTDCATTGSLIEGMDYGEARTELLRHGSTLAAVDPRPHNLKIGDDQADCGKAGCSIAWQDSQGQRYEVVLSINEADPTSDFKVTGVNCGAPSANTSDEPVADSAARPTAPASTSQSQPSFDCSKAVTDAEWLICGNPSLGELDVTLAVAYKNRLRRTANPDQLRKEQADWMKNVRVLCKDVECMTKAYADRIDELGRD